MVQLPVTAMPCFLLFVWGRVLLHSLSWPYTCYVAKGWPQTHDSPPASAFQLGYKYISSCLALSFLFNRYIQPSLSHHSHENSRSRGKITLTVRYFPHLHWTRVSTTMCFVDSFLCSVLVSQFSYHLWVTSVCWSSKQTKILCLIRLLWYLHWFNILKIYLHCKVPLCVCSPTCIL